MPFYKSFTKFVVLYKLITTDLYRNTEGLKRITGYGGKTG